MLFNQNIVLDILRSNFMKEIVDFADDYVMTLDDCELDAFFESTVDFAILNYIDGMEIENYFVEEEEDGQNVEGTFEIIMSVDGYKRIDEENIFKESSIMNLEIGFSFYAENNKYSHLALEYLY